MSVIGRSKAMEDEAAKALDALVAAGDVLGGHLAAALKERDEARQQLQGAVSEFVAYLRACGPASDPAEWHRLMAKHDPEYPESDVGRAYLALGQ